MSEPDTKSLAIVHTYRNLYLSRTPKDNFDRAMWENLNVLSAAVDKSGGTAKISFSIIIPKHFSNHLGTFHGGALATLFDGLSSSALALIMKKGFWDGGEVTRVLEITCFRPIPVGELINADVEIVHAGQRLAAIRGGIRKPEDGTILASCTHEKFSPSAGAGAKL